MNNNHNIIYWASYYQHKLRLKREQELKMRRNFMLLISGLILFLILFYSSRVSYWETDIKLVSNEYCVGDRIYIKYKGNIIDVTNVSPERQYFIGD